MSLHMHTVDIAQNACNILESNDSSELTVLENAKICIHKYKVEYKTNTQPPGFADFLRGTISLYQYCKKYNYKLYIDPSSHPIYKYFQINDNYFLSTENDAIEAFGYPYEIIDNMLKDLFESNNYFTIITNAFYRKNMHDKDITNFIEFDDQELKNFMKNILTPTYEINIKIDNIFKYIYKINRNEKYKIIHARCGDNFIHNANYIDESVFIDVKQKIQNILNEDSESKYILITDSEIMGKLWNEQIPQILYWDNNKNHLGDLKRGLQNVEDTVIDFIIMSGAEEIIGCSGFSKIISIIYDIPIKIYNVLYDIPIKIYNVL